MRLNGVWLRRLSGVVNEIKLRVDEIKRNGR